MEEEAALVREAVGTHTAHSPTQAGGTELLEPQLIFTKKSVFLGTDQLELFINP